MSLLLFCSQNGSFVENTAQIYIQRHMGLERQASNYHWWYSRWRGLSVTFVLFLCVFLGFLSFLRRTRISWVIKTHTHTLYFKKPRQTALLLMFPTNQTKQNDPSFAQSVMGIMTTSLSPKAQEPLFSSCPHGRQQRQIQRLRHLMRCFYKLRAFPNGGWVEVTVIYLGDFHRQCIK